MAYRHQPGVYDPKFKSNRRRRELEDMLQEWYGKEFASSEITARTDQAQKLSTILDTVLEKHINDQTLQLMELRSQWDSLIGPPLNKFVQLASLKDATLFLEVSHPAFLMELRKKNATDSLLERIRSRFPDLEIGQISFVPSGQSQKNQ